MQCTDNLVVVEREDPAKQATNQPTPASGENRATGSAELQARRVGAHGGVLDDAVSGSKQSGAKSNTLALYDVQCAESEVRWNRPSASVPRNNGAG